MEWREIAARLRKEREGAGRSQTDLAEEIGTTQQRLARYEAGDNEGITLRSYARWCAALGLPQEEAFGWYDPAAGGGFGESEKKRQKSSEIS